MLLLKALTFSHQSSRFHSAVNQAIHQDSRPKEKGSQEVLRWGEQESCPWPHHVHFCEGRAVSRELR